MALVERKQIAFKRRLMIIWRISASGNFRHLLRPCEAAKKANQTVKGRCHIGLNLLVILWRLDCGGSYYAIQVGNEIFRFDANDIDLNLSRGLFWRYGVASETNTVCMLLLFIG